MPGILHEGVLVRNQVAKGMDVEHTRIEHCFQSINVIQRPRLTVDSLYPETKQVNSLDALIHNHGDSKAVSLIKATEMNAKHWLGGWGAMVGGTVCRRSAGPRRLIRKSQLRRRSALG